MTKRCCGVAVEGPYIPGGRKIPTWRGSCKNPPLLGFNHCRHHLTPEERERRAKEAVSE